MKKKTMKEGERKFHRRTINKEDERSRNEEYVAEQNRRRKTKKKNLEGRWN